jgi:sensor histidine kinase YesM
MILFLDLIATVIDVFLITFFSIKWLKGNPKSILMKIAVFVAFGLAYIFINLSVITFFDVFVGENASVLIFGRGIGHYLLLFFAKFLFAVIAALALAVKNKRESDERLRFLDFAIKTQSEYLEQVRVNAVEIRKMRHDINKYLGITGELLKSGKTEKAIEYLSEISANYKTETLITTDSDIISAVLNLKLSQCNENGIKFNCKIIGSMNGISETELSILLFNLLDNAIEAAVLQLSPFVDVYIAEEKAYLKIVIKNSSAQTDLNDNALPKTTKSDKSLHGFGLLTVSDIVNKYEGLMNLTKENDVFIADIRLKIQSK